MGELKESPRSGFIGAFADALKKSKSIADKVDVPVIGKLGQAMLGQFPEEVDNWSYGNAPLAMPPSGTGGYIPVTKTGRAQGLADAVMVGAPMAQGTLKGAANIADRASTAAVRKILGDATMTPMQVMDIAGSLMPSPVIRNMPAPKWNAQRGQAGFPLGDWTNEGKMIAKEVWELAADPQSISPIDRVASLRGLKENATGKIRYSWPSGAALHDDVGAMLKLNPEDWRHIEFIP